MSTFLAILIILAMVATVAALVRGIVIFLRTSDQERLNPGQGPSASGLRQNKMMRMRILFQGIAILLVVLLLSLARSHGS
jgi:NADH:ubiquinone oxidoreductase subunit 3 (subunit A)